MKITLKAARINAGLKQREAAKLIGVSRKTLSLYETGLSFPKVDIAEKISMVYGIDKESIIFLKSKNA